MAKILVVDDEPGYLELLDLVLKADGHEVETSQAGKKAIEIGQHWYPDLLLADWRLKDDLCGLDVARALYADNHRLVTIIITGYSAVMLRSQAQDIQNLYVLEKPFDTDSLRDVIRDVMGQKGCMQHGQDTCRR